MGYERKARKYLVDTLWREHSVNLFCGSSGAWKTSAYFTFMDQLDRGEKILGNESHACPWAYVAFDRDLNDTWDTLDSIKYSPDPSKLYSKYDNWPYPKNLGGLLTALPKILPQGGLLGIDGLQVLAGSSGYNINNYSEVENFVFNLHTGIKRCNVTANGLCHNAKAKDNEGYSNPRDQILGSAAWAATVNTILAFGRRPDGDKDLWVLPRTTTEYKLVVTRDDKGRVIMRNTDEDTNSALVLNTRLIDLCDGAELERGTVVAWAMDAGLTELTADRWLKNACGKMGKLQRVGRGLYCKLRQQ
jgi:hypothetical protein